MTPNPDDTARTANPAPFQVGDWHVDPATNSLSRTNAAGGADDSTSLEPKVMDLLVLLASDAGQVFSRQELDAALWPDVTVGEDTLARTVSKLRRALGDQADAPTYIQTIPKRGYQLIAAVVEEADPGGMAAVAAPSMPLSTGWKIGLAALAILLTLGLLTGPFLLRADEPQKAGRAQSATPADMTERAHDLYMRFTRIDNEAAIELYERAIATDPAYAPALAGLANALVQRVIRWQSVPGETSAATSLSEALASGLTKGPEEDAVLARAEGLASRAITLAPRNAEARKALGFAQSARGKISEARQSYRQTLDLDGNAWEARINLGELASIEGEETEALDQFEKAYTTMDALYAEEPQRIGEWRAPLGVLIAKGHRRAGDDVSAEIWYRRVLGHSPLDPDATKGLAALLRDQGDRVQAGRLCRDLAARIGPQEDCETD